MSWVKAQGHSDVMHAALLARSWTGFGAPRLLTQLSLHQAGIQPPACLWLPKVKGSLHLRAESLRSETQSQQNLLLANLSFLASKEGNWTHCSALNKMKRGPQKRKAGGVTWPRRPPFSKID